LSQPNSGRTMFPQWVLEVIRPIVGGVSRVFWKIEFSGLENVPKNGGLIIASNHQTYLDPFWLSLPIKRPIRYLAWSAAFKWPVVGRGLRLFGAWPLALEGSDPAAIRRSLQWLREGGAVVIFPEGTRTAPGRRLAYQPGVAALYQALGLPLVPAAVNSGLFWGRRSFLKRPGRITLEFLDPIPPGLGRREVMAQLEESIETATAALEQEATVRQGSGKRGSGNQSSSALPST